jgi:3-hydroxyacyl-[acyl-carrier-protein] dehydratase
MVTNDRIEGNYTFKPDEYFYQGHFVGNPITPGVILTECMAQIGLACFGIHLMVENKALEGLSIAMSSSQTDYLKAVLPGETVKVIALKEYFRFNKLKCKVKMLNADNQIVCNGILSGMIIYSPKNQ